MICHERSGKNQDRRTGGEDGVNITRVAGGDGGGSARFMARNEAKKIMEKLV